MKKSVLPISAALALLVLAGCQQKATVVGKWQGKSIELPPSTQSGEEAKMAELSKQMAEAFVKALEFEFKQDGTATMSAMGFSMNGKYTLAGNQVTFTPEAGQMIMGQKLESKDAKASTMTLSADGKQLVLEPQSPEQGKTILERKVEEK